MSENRTAAQVHEITEYPRAAPYSTIWCKRPEDPAQWCWGGDYNVPGLLGSELRTISLRAEYPTFEWEVRDGDGR